MFDLQFLALSLFVAYLAVANPVPSPKPTPPPFVSSDHDRLATEPCVYTTTVLSVVGFDGHWAPTLTKTIYTETVTVAKVVDCFGCARLAIETNFLNLGHGPVIESLILTTATTPTRATTTVCINSVIPTRQAIPGTPNPRAEVSPL
jgi:hypothetical protein